MLDQVVDVTNHRLYLLTSGGLRACWLSQSNGWTQVTPVFNAGLPVQGTRLALSRDGRTAFIGGQGHVTAVNLYAEGVFNGKAAVTVAAFEHVRRHAFPEGLRNRGVAAMGVHPSGERLYVVIDMLPEHKKLKGAPKFLDGAGPSRILGVPLRRRLAFQLLLSNGDRVFTFVEHPTFTKQVDVLFDEDEYRSFQTTLAMHPQAGKAIPGLGGLRKVRWAAKGKGKRGGARIIYLLIPRPEIIYLLSLYTKGDISDLSPDQKRRLVNAVDAIKAEYQA